MISKFVKGKVYVFVDVSNVFYSQKTLGWRIAYTRLMEYFKRECGDDVKCFAYAAYNENRRSERKFLDMLDISGYVLRTKSLKKINTRRGETKAKGNLDVELALEMVKFANDGKYETAILVSGDSDFAPALEMVKELNRRVMVMSTRGRVAKELLDLAKFIDLRKLKKEIALEKAP